MRILISAVSSARYPSGICRHAANLARCLAARIEVSNITLLVGKWQEDYFRSVFGLRDPKLEISGVDVSDRSLARNWWYLRDLPEKANAYSPDIVHLSFPIPVLRGRFPCPLVTSLHDLYPYDAPENFGFPRVIFNRVFLQQCLRNSDTITCGSDFTLARLHSVAPTLVAVKATRIYQSIELHTGNIQEPLLPELDGRPFLLSVAQHRNNKNLVLLVNAFADLVGRGGRWRDTSLLIVGGEGPQTQRLKNLVNQLSLQQRIHFKTSLTDPELCWLYANCVVFIAPSTVEGFGMPVIEALRCGCRVVCSDIPVFREVAGAACHYFDLRAASPVTALADAACTALHDQPRRPEKLDRFSPQQIGAQYVSLYATLLGASSMRTDAGSSLI